MHVFFGLFVIPIALVAMAAAAHSTECSADAEYVRASPTSSDKARWKLRFKVRSDDCAQSVCQGLIQYRIHFHYSPAKSRADEGHRSGTSVKYVISQGQKSTEVTDEKNPGASTGSALEIEDVSIEKVSCSTR